MTISEGYRKTYHCNRVKDAAYASGVRLGASIVLDHLCRWSKSDGPFVDDSREQICKGTKLCDKTVKAALARLRALGVLVVDRASQRGKGTRYRLMVIPVEGEESSPPNAGNGGEEYSERGGRKFPKGGEESSPLHRTFHKSSHGDERSAAGRAAAGPHGPLGEAERAELETFSREHRELGLHEAMRRAKERRAQMAA